jgi:hypothetical protein
MSFTVIKRVVVIASLALASYWANPAFAASANTEAAVVASLYKDFAWQAFASQDDLFGADLAHQNKAALGKYFAPPLAALLLQDSACQMKSQGICNLDFDLLFDSQDPRITDLDVAILAPGKVTVQFKDPVSDQTTKIQFNVARVAGQWKITDIIYGTKSERSLRKILSRKSL